MLLLWFLIPICYADPSILLIGGEFLYVEKFDPSTMNSTIIARHNELLYMPHATPVNDTHAIFTQTDTEWTYYINKTGGISRGPELVIWESGQGKMGYPVATLCNARGPPQVVSCGGSSKNCAVMSKDGTFEAHSTMNNLTVVFTLTAFGKELIAVGKTEGKEKDNGNAKAERYDGSNWRTIEPPPDNQRRSTAVKLNDNQLLSCGGSTDGAKCHVYNLKSDTWNEGPEAKYFLLTRGALALVGETVFAFAYEKIQTLDLSNGIAAKWKLESAKLNKDSVFLGIWVIDESPACPTTPPTTTITTTTDEPTSDATSGSMVTDGQQGFTFAMILMVLLVVVFA